MRLTIALICFFFCTSVYGQLPINLDSLTTILERVYKADQEPRFALDSLLKKYSSNAPEFQQAINLMSTNDSLNKEIVTAIIDKYGWLSAKETSEKANSTLFLVIQHADLNTQLKYLPILRKAVLEGKAKADNYAYLLDRTNIKQGKFQVYGSQLSPDRNGKMYFDPIIDEPNINVRRKQVGLPALEQFAKQIGTVYKVPKVDSLKNKIVLIIRLYENQQPLSAVTVYLGNNKKIGTTDENGFLKIAVDKSYRHWALIFRKEGYTSSSYVLDNADRNIFEIDIGLQKN